MPCTWVAHPPATENSRCVNTLRMVSMRCWCRRKDASPQLKGHGGNLWADLGRSCRRHLVEEDGRASDRGKGIFIRGSDHQASRTGLLR